MSASLGLGACAARRLGVATLLALSMVPPAWAIIYVPPVVTSIARLQPGPVTTANTLTWRVTFNTSVTGVDSSDFTLTPVDGSATGTITSVAAGSSVREYIVTATGVSGTGTLRLDVNASGTDIIGGPDDLPLAGGFTLGQPYTHTSFSVALAWGNNGSGQLGNGLATNTSVPLAVPESGALVGKTVAAVAAGSTYSLALCSDGTVVAWGGNVDGRLGNNSTTDSLVPVAVDTMSGRSALYGKTVVAVAAGRSHSLALCSDGTVVAWGKNVGGQLGNNATISSSVPVAVDTTNGTSALYGKTVVAVAAGEEHSLALCSDGAVVAWGRGGSGQLGNNSPGGSLVPVAVDTTNGTSALHGKTVVAVAAGAFHSVALCSDGTVAAWGFNNYGQLGNGLTGNRSTPVAVSTTSGTSALDGKTVVAVAVGGYHSAALCSDGTVATWGFNSNGQLGNATTTDSKNPVPVKMDAGTSALHGKTVVALASGGFHLLARCSDGTVAAWGANSDGRLGDKSTTDSLVPVAVNTDAGTSALSGMNITLFGLGYDAGHSLGLASPSAIVTAVAAPGAGLYKAGDGLNFTLTLSGAVTVTGSPRLVLTVGSTTHYARYVSGTGTTSLVFTYTVQVGDTDTDGIAVATAIDFNGGTISNSYGRPIDPAVPVSTLPQLVVDTTAPAAPTIVAATATEVRGTAEPGSSVGVYNGATLLGTATADSSGNWSLAVALADGSYSLTATATDAAGNAGTVSSTSSLTVDTTAPVVASIARLMPGPVTTAGTLTWRVTFSEAVTGVDISDFTLTPVDGSATGTLSSVAAGSSTAEYIVTATGVSGIGTLRLDVKSSGTGIADSSNNALTSGFTLGQPYTHTSASVPVAWGWNWSGQLGNNLKTNSPVPVDVLGIGALAGKTVVALATGYQHSLALCSDGTVAAWGNNGSGRLGNNSTTNSLVPVAVNTDSGTSALAGKTVVAVAAGDMHSLALCSDGTVAAWGDNNYGQLGNNSWDGSPVPVAVNTESGTSALAGKTVVAVAAGGQYSLALCSDGMVTAWGWNELSQLGNATTTTSPVPVPVNTASGTSALSGKTVVAVAAGDMHSLALCSDGTAVAWGVNWAGQLGNGSTTDSLVPVAVNAASALSGKTVVAVSAGAEHSLALCNDGTVAAWGNNGSGRLGNDSTTNSPVPVAVSTVSGTSALSGKTVVAVSAGLDHSLALCSDGTAVAWGNNSYGQLGNGSTTTSLVPVAVNTAGSSALSGRTVSFLGTGGIGYYTLALASPAPATVTALSAPATGSYKAGDVLSFTLTTSAAATVDTTGGTPRLALTIGTATRYATYVSGSGTTNLVFTYTVQAGDTDTDGIAIASTSIDLNGGTISNAPGVAIDALLPSFTLPVIGVDAAPPLAPVVAAAGLGSVTGYAEPGSSVEVWIDGALAGTVTADATTGAWTCTLSSPLVAGSSHAFTAKATDAAGNSGAPSSPRTITVSGSGSTWVATLNTDHATAPAAGSLRYALDHAVSGDAIVFALPSGSETVTLAAALPPITHDLTIDGGSLGAVIIDGADAYRVFFVDTGVVALKNLRIQNARAEGGAGGTGDGGGGGGAGLGAGLFVNQATADVTVTNVSFISMHAVGGAGGALVSQSFAGGGGGGMGYRGGSTMVNGAGPGGGGMLAPGSDVMSGLDGGAGGVGGGGGGGRRLSGLSGLGGSAYAGNDAGNDGTTPSGVDGAGGAGGFGGGGGGAAVASGGAGGFGGGGGGTGSNTPGGAGGPGGGGGGGDGYSVAASGGSLGSGVSGGQSGLGSGAGGGGGAAAGPAIFVRLGKLTTVDSAWSVAIATGGAGGTGLAGHNGSAGTADATPIFNYAGRVNGSTTTGPVPSALVACTPVLSSVTLGSDGATASLAKFGDTITLGFTASRPLAAPTVTLGGHNVTATHVSGNMWAASFTVAGTDPEGAVSFSVAFASIDGFAGSAVTATTDASAVTIDTTAPTVPAGLAATVPSTSAIALSWTASTDAVGVAGYRIYRDGVAIGTNATAAYTDTGLTAGTAYTYTVTAYDAAGHESAASAAVVATTQYAGPQALSVDNTGELVAALATIAANPSANYTLTLAAGTYRPALGLTLAGDQVTLHSNGTVVLDGSGLSAGALLTVTGDEAVIHGVTFRQAPAEAIAIVAGAAAGTVADCTFEGAGISGTACPGWTITGNTFNDLVGSSASAAAAITFSGGADDLTVTDNVILDCDRGIALTASAGAKVRNNFIADNRTSGHPGAAIALVEVTDAQIDHNTLYAAGSHANAIEYSGGVAIGAMRNNLTNKPIVGADTATATLATNVATAEASWFKDPGAGDLHLVATRSGVVDAGTAIAGFTVDIDRDARPTGSAYDIGADEFQPDTLAPTVPTNLGARATASSSVGLSWTASTDSAPAGATATGVAGYRIYRNGTAVGTTTSTSYTDTGLSVGTAYSYTVTAFDGAANESARSTAVNVTTPAGADSGGGKGGGGACGLILPSALALLLALRRRRR